MEPQQSSKSHDHSAGEQALWLVSVKRCDTLQAANRTRKAEVKRLKRIKVPSYARKLLAVKVPRLGWAKMEVS